MAVSKTYSWLRRFRMHDLPTAPGDALAGAAFMMPAGDAALPQAFAAGVGALFMHMARRTCNGAVCAVCVMAAIWLPSLMTGGGMPFAWNVAMCVLLGCAMAHNNLKKAWLAGACRGMGVVCGGLAVWRPGGNPYTGMPLPADCFLLASLALLAFGWCAYSAAAAKLSDAGECPCEGLGYRRFLSGLSAFLPLAAFAAAAFAPGVEYESWLVVVLPAAGCCCAFVAWCIAVGPLWLPHGREERRRAGESAVFALLYIQIGFMLMVVRPAFLAAAAGLWGAARAVQRLASKAKEDANGS